MIKGLARLAAIIAAAVLVALVVANVGYPKNYSLGYTDSSKSTFVDERGLFSELETEQIIQRIKEVSEQAKLNIYITVSAKSFDTESKTEIYADDTYDSIYGEDSDGLFYFMDFSGKTDSYDYLSLSGRACLLFDSSRYYLVDSTGNKLPSSAEVLSNGLEKYKDQVSGAIYYFLNEIARSSDGSKEAEYVHTNNGKYVFRRGGELYVAYSKPPFIRFKILLIGELAGFIVGLIIYAVTKSTYKFKTKTDPGVYVNTSDVHFYTRTDAFLRTHTSRTRLDSGGGGGYRGGGGGGGGHSFSGGHTGAGHHR